ncbi:hypothetical protein [Streptomyces blastmyceticus]|uniref:Uncharacterized protein n=1 Tax=Streptomyces blastmyceticus TaxID=68180 RepID=A0ABN0WTR5_9ACTN
MPSAPLRTPEISHVTDVIVATLEHQGVPPYIASLAARCGIAVLVRVRLDWLAGDTRGCPILLADAFADLASLVGPSTWQGFSSAHRW